MRKVELRMKEELKYLVIKKLVETNGNKKRAAIKLGCTVRHIDILKYVQNSAFESFVNGETNVLEISAASGIGAFEASLRETKNADNLVISAKE